SHWRLMMILKSFIPGNLISLYMTIINSVVMVGLYYGFLTTLSIGPSYIFLQDRNIEPKERSLALGIKKQLRVSFLF
ncbi:hypothetical protein ES319_A05G056100v1, partial [Gossypium barbadense]